jgi:NADPH:quinone reductase-like Zn-dependent oxidoreductase
LRKLGLPEGIAMRAVRVHELGGVEKMLVEKVPVPLPGEGQVLVQVHAAGVGPWDALIRSGRSVVPPELPLTLGSDLSGRLVALGPGVRGFREGDAVYGVTNQKFTGAYAEYALAEAGMMAKKPESLSFVEAASVPVVAITAWQMLYDHGHVEEGQRVLIHGAAGNVGAYAVQMARHASAHVIATGHTSQSEAIREMGPDEVIDADARPFEEQVRDVDLVLDTLGGDALRRSFSVLKRGGALISVAGHPDQDLAREHGVRAEFFLVEVTTDLLDRIGRLLDASALRTNIGETLPLSEARVAHEMLEGKPHKPGKIVLTMV